ncbi:MAG: hypothetical protein MK165_14325, partial [Pirellulaceae bacterium]|nr:hypothetical protein [Pirellulaceae bacterium]
MKRLLGLLLVMGIVGCGDDDHSHDVDNHGHNGSQVLQGSRQEKTADEQDAALKALEQLGAKLTRNEQGLVIAVHLGSNDTETTSVEQGTASDAGIAHLAGMTSLEIVSLVGPQITNAGLLNLSGLTNLRHLELYAPQVTDAGVAHLKGLPKLNFLALDLCSKITDASVVHLSTLTKLETLCLLDTQVTEAGIAELQQALPNCEIR